MRGLVLFFLMLLSAASYAQLETERIDFYLLSGKGKSFPNDSQRSHISFSAAFELNSNALTNDFVKSLFYRGYIGNGEKDQVSERLGNSNRFGFDFTGGVTYKYQLKKELTLISGLYVREHFNSRFTRDAFELVFRGNQMFAGKYADLKNSGATYFNYQSLMLGAVKSVSSSLKLGAALSLIRGGNYTSIKTGRASLYTDTDGAYLDFDMDFRLQYSSGNSFLSSHGAGAALNLFMMHQTQRGLLSFEVRDLGVIRWNDLNTYKGNNMYHYEGAFVEDILKFNDTTLVETRVDSVAKDLGIAKEQQDNTFFIPATIHLSYMFDLSDRLGLAGGIKYLTTSSYIPRVYVKGICHLGNTFILVPAVAYGGFGRMDFELGAAKTFKCDWTVSANAFLLEYLALPKSTSGHGFNLCLTKLF